MPLKLTSYIKIKDKYCIAYYGFNEQYLTTLRLLIPVFNKHYPDIKIYICCRDDLYQQFSQLECFLPKSQYNLTDFGHTTELKEVPGGENPVLSLIKKSKIDVDLKNIKNLINN